MKQSCLNKRIKIVVILNCAIGISVYAGFSASLHTPETLETVKKSTPCLTKKLQSVPQIVRLKQRFLSFAFYKTQKSYEKIMRTYLLFHLFKDESCIIFTFSLHKGQQTSTD